MRRRHNPQEVIWRLRAEKAQRSLDALDEIDRAEEEVANRTAQRTVLLQKLADSWLSAMAEADYPGSTLLTLRRKAWFGMSEMDTAGWRIGMYYPLSLESPSDPFGHTRYSIFALVDGNFAQSIDHSSLDLVGPWKLSGAPNVDLSPQIFENIANSNDVNWRITSALSADEAQFLGS